jgi:hypothetical protein
MRKNRSLRNIGLVAVALFVIGVTACSTGSDADDESAAPNSAGSVGSVGAPADGATSIFDSGKALGDVDNAREESATRIGGESAAAGAPGAGPVPQGGALVTTVDRKIVSSASIQMQVENVGGSFEEVGRIASAAGGFVASSSFSYHDDAQIASVTIRVPSDGYQGVLSSLRALGVKVDAENSDATDVTEEYTDLASRLRTLEATETQLLTLLARAETITDILTVQDRLNFTRTEIEQVKGRIQLLDDLTDLATITVHLRPVVAGNGGEPGTGVDLGNEIAEAWDESIEFLGEVAAGVLTVVVFAWWVPVAGLPLLLGYKAVTKRRDAAEAAD